MTLGLFLRSFVLLLIALATAFVPAHAKKDGPEITSTKFENALENIFYFDDSNIILGQDRETNTVWRSTDAGENWKKVDDDGQAGQVWDLWPHPFDNQRAYMLGIKTKHWITTDQGETWRSFDSSVVAALFRTTPLAFHGRDPAKVIWNGETCIGGFACEEVAFYTVDDFQTVNELREGTRGCAWAVGTPQFAEDAAVVVKDRAFCIVRGLYSPFPADNRLLVSDDFFDTEIEPGVDGNRAVTGIISMAAVKKYLVAAAKSEGTDELALYVTDDSSTWHRAEFGRGHRIEEDAYTILESTNYSMQVDVLASKPTNPMGHLFTSNSNGTYFTKNIDYTNRNIFGRVDFEKIANIQGIVLVNIVENHEEVERSNLAEKIVQTKISFDDGRTFQDLMVGDKRLHLHSVTDAQNGGRVFSSPAPGIVMGVGNTGKRLRPYEDGDLYISDDAGVTWRKALDGAHKYEFGNQGAVIMAIGDEDSTDQIRYSINHGKDWKKAELDVKIRAKYLTTVPDSTTLKFLLVGTHGSGSSTEWHVFKIDFEGLHERACGDKDFEKWPARVDEDGKPTCIMGHKQFFRRRKPGAECFIDGEFKDPIPEFEPCSCTKEDFECDFNFMRTEDGKDCVPTAPLQVPHDVCRDPKGTFKGSSGWRLIPGNACTRKDGVDLDEEVERPCSDTVNTPSSGEVSAEKTYFDADAFVEWYYLERGKNVEGDDETIVMRTTEQEIYLSKDHGKTWTRILKGEPITAITPHPHERNYIYFLTGGAKVHYSIDRGENLRSFDAPAPPSTIRMPILKFHHKHKDWLLWAGSVGGDSHTNCFYSTDRGSDWKVLARYTRKCEFIAGEGRTASDQDQLVYCEQYEDENPDKNLRLLSSSNWFADEREHFPDILDFATMSEFIIVAAKTEDRQSLKVDASVDGQTFAAAEFPANFKVKHQQAYTVLDSSTHAVFLHVTVNPNKDQEYGTIIKSNSNGTSYVMTLENVNRDTDGYVDFEKMLGLEGVAMVNVVANVKQAEQTGEKKKLKSMITHNDGAEWALIPPPEEDALGNPYPCVKEENKATDKCSLHLHSYTERTDKGATFSSSNAPGMMLAVGNVGEFLTRKEDESTDTFITRDAGLTWTSVKKGSYMWEYGDQGSVIVIVEESTPTRKLFYTLDEGQHWIEYMFSPDVDMSVSAITTLPSDNSLNFLLWGKETGANAKRGIVTVNVDFTSLKEREKQCELDDNQPTMGDYYFWEPKHPMQEDNCLFGHVAQYHRKKISSECRNGKVVDHLDHFKRNCTCTRQDYEW